MTRRRARGLRCIALAASLASALAARGAFAQPTDAQLQEARDMFLAAEKDEDAGRWAEALSKFHRIAEIRRTAGVRYHEALCEEQLGRLALALADYTAADAQARNENAQDVLRLVGPRLADLGPRVPRLIVTVTPDLPDARVSIDGAPLPRSSLGVSMPMELGSHRIDATAPNRPTTTTTITMHERDATNLEMRLGEPGKPVAPTPTPTPTATPTSPAPAAHSRSSVFPALVATGATVVLAGAGLAAFLVAGQHHSDAVASCAQVASAAGDACDSQKGSVRTWDWVAAGLWLGATATAIDAVVLFVTRDSPAPATARVVVGPASVAVAGSF